jgi:hypothetical protein
MVFGRLANLLTTADTGSNIVDDGRGGSSFAMPHAEELPQAGGSAVRVEEEIDSESARPPYIHVGALIWSL